MDAAGSASAPVGRSPSPGTKTLLSAPSVGPVLPEYWAQANGAPQGVPRIPMVPYLPLRHGIMSPGRGGVGRTLQGIQEQQEVEGKKINWQPLATEEDLKEVEDASPFARDASCSLQTPSISGSAVSVPSTIIRRNNSQAGSAPGRSAVASSDETLVASYGKDSQGATESPGVEPRVPSSKDGDIEPPSDQAQIPYRLEPDLRTLKAVPYEPAAPQTSDQVEHPQPSRHFSAPCMQDPVKQEQWLQSVLQAAHPQVHFERPPRLPQEADPKDVYKKATELAFAQGELAAGVLASPRTEPNLRSLVGRFGCPSLMGGDAREQGQAREKTAESRQASVRTEGSEAPSPLQSRSPSPSEVRRDAWALGSLQEARLEYRKDRPMAGSAPKQVRAIHGSLLAPPAMPLSARGSSSRSRPTVEAAVFEVTAAAAALRVEELSELKILRKPPHYACQVVEAVAVALGFPDPGWGTVRRRLDSLLLQKMGAFDAASATALPLGKALRFIELVSSPEFVATEPRKERCPAIPGLIRWCLAVAALFARIQSNMATSADQSPTSGHRPSSVPPASKGFGDAPGHAPHTGSMRTPRGAAGRSGSGQLSPSGSFRPEAKAGAKAAVRKLGDKGRVQSPLSARRDVKPEILGDYTVEPALWRMTEAQLSSVSELKIVREGYGYVVFHGVTDCRDLIQQLRRLVVIDRGEVVLYPDPSLKPPIGEGLNKPASVVLLGCMPKSQDRLQQPRRQERYRQRVAKMTEEKGAIFEDYNCEDGTWKFRVDHF